MKNLPSISTVQLDPALERQITKRDIELKELAQKNATHFGNRNLPDPESDVFEHYTGELKAGYEKMAADVSNYFQPAAHFPEGKIDVDTAKEKNGELEAKIQDLQHQNQNALYVLPGQKSNNATKRIQWTLFATGVIIIGEVLFNTKSFQVTSENLLFALLLALSVSFAVFVFSHMVPLLYKEAKTKLHRRIVIVGSLLLVIGLFTALAIFRSTYLAAHGVHVAPIYFIIINVFFFVVSALLSFFVLPNWLEIKEEIARFKALRAIAKREKEILQLQKDQEQLKETLAERTKYRLRIIHSAKYSTARFKKMYHESVAIFKRTNLAHRSDKRTPECFDDRIPELEIEEIVFNSPSNRRA